MESSRLAADVERLAESLGQLPEAAARPVFIVISGLPGTGKSYFSSKLAERLPLVILESDALRKVLFPAPDYSPEESQRLFQAVHLLIEKLLKKGISLILDATNLTEQHREYLYNIADRLRVKLILVRVEAPPGLVRRRLNSRFRDSWAKSDADWAIYRQMKTSVEKIRRKHYVVNTSRDITPILDKIVLDVKRMESAVSTASTQ
ncbi:MAG: ATP-binding protein [Chloroflexi bacterium]|nr:ATP-binding protein [Chloroflexota bacterium]